ncbi:MAG TPA: carboxypeptidase regulatory-like domain-containing protein [Bryobacteraceae bacterium]|nr:carboxypeptidase regulatory-like domain-containing protein [Bryobacteraceae bacterium]
MFLSRVGSLLTALILTAATGLAAAVSGLVKDPSGTAVASAVIAIRSITPSGTPRMVRTDTAGAFRASDLPPGRYSIHLVMPGFEAFDQEIEVTEGKDTAIEIHLKLGEVRQQVEVEGTGRATVDPVYHQLRESGLGEGFTVENLVIHRDGGTITLKSGTLAMSAPVLGRDTEAVFVGEGEFTFTPVLAVEGEHLNIVTGENAVHESFDRALFCFTDAAGKEIREQAKAHTADGKLAEVLRDFRHHLRSRTESPRSQLDAMLQSDTMDNLDADILADLYNPSQPGFFSAYLHGHKHSDLRFQYRPRGVMPDLSPEEVGVINLDPGGEQEGIWYLSHLKSEFDKGQAFSDEDHRVVKVDRYKIETVIAKNDHFTAAAEIHIQPITNGDRVIKFGLLPSLRVTRVTNGGREIAFIQEDRRQDGSFYVIMPLRMAKGSEQSLTVEYQGDRVVYKAGGGNFSVGARESWYPSLNTFRDHALYNLIFKVPKDFTLVSVGKLVREWKEEGFACSEWNSDIPMAVAGFNYGLFKKKGVEDTQTGIHIEGYAASEVPAYLQGAANSGAVGSLTPSRLLEGALVDAQNSERVFNAWFGKSEFPRIAITQQPQFSFGQSWPTLVYLPMSAFLDSTQRWQLMGGISTRLNEFVDEVTPHEVSHQWWGHEVGWASYHDQWLSEGFAFFSAGLYLQLVDKDPARYLTYWQRARELLSQKNNYNKRPTEAGPVWMGLRLGTFRNPGAYNSVVYRKGGYILYMLKSMMHDPMEGDRYFIEMMKDFVNTYRNRNASTEDFLAIAQKHMRPGMDMTGDGKLTWFFSEWVYGTALPKYKFDYTVTAESDGKWLLNGNLTQSDVPDKFVMPVPVYADFDGKMLRLGQVKIVGNTTVTDIKVKLPEKPRKVAINALHDVLEQ